MGHELSHLCPLHQRLYEDWKKKQPDFDLRRGEQQELLRG
jgi:hypothetical protein